MVKTYLNILSVLLMAAMLPLAANAQVWDGSSTPWTSGDGSESNPFQIENAGQLAYLAETVNGGETYVGKYFKLTADIDLGAASGLEFPVIGKLDKYSYSSNEEMVDESVYFKGTLDGDNHVIDNMNINYVNEELGGTGLFACTASETVIRNISIGENSTITGGLTCGSLVGQMNGGLIENCRNMATVNGNMFTGGIVGVMEGGVVRSCVNDGTVIGYTEVGGIIGQGAGSAQVTTCYNTASVTALGFGGAGIGGALYEKFAIKNCYNIGKITGGSSPFLGSPHAIVSDVSFGTVVNNCYYVEELAGVGDTKATAKTADEMKSADFPALLNAGVEPAAFVVDETGINDGFPVLAWQVEDLSSGVGRVMAGYDVSLEIVDGKVRCDVPVTVYDFSGRAVASGRELTLGKGMYVVKAGNVLRKVIVK